MHPHIVSAISSVRYCAHSTRTHQLHPKAEVMLSCWSYKIVRTMYFVPIQIIQLACVHISPPCTPPLHSSVFSRRRKTLQGLLRTRTRTRTAGCRLFMQSTQQRHTHILYTFLCCHYAGYKDKHCRYYTLSRYTACSDASATQNALAHPF